LSEKCDRKYAYLPEKDGFLEIVASKLRKIKDLIWEIHAIESCYLDLESSLRELTDYEKERLRVLFGSIETHNIIQRTNSKMKYGQKPLPVRELKSPEIPLA
jgi:hypothetical protein